MVYFTSDTHAFHKNLTKGVSKWPNKTECRDFANPEEMTNLLVDNINKCVQPDDTLFHLGDWSFHSVGNIFAFRNRIKCKNIHLILGNHDSDLYADPSCHSLFSSIDFYREININGRKIVLCHYPIATWNKCHHDSWMLHGHCHGKLQHQIPAQLLKHLIDKGQWDIIRKLANNEQVPGITPNGKRMDVGVDTHPEFRPYSITEIDEIMKTRFFVQTDNHAG